MAHSKDKRGREAKKPKKADRVKAVAPTPVIPTSLHATHAATPHPAAHK